MQQFKAFENHGIFSFILFCVNNAFVLRPTASIESFCLSIRWFGDYYALPKVIVRRIYTRQVSQPYRAVLVERGGNAHRHLAASLAIIGRTIVLASSA